MPVRDLNHKRVCDLSEDGREVFIRRGDCVTVVRANPDGTLGIRHIRDSRD